MELAVALSSAAVVELPWWAAVALASAAHREDAGEGEALPWSSPSRSPPPP